MSDEQYKNIMLALRVQYLVNSFLWVLLIVAIFIK